MMLGFVEICNHGMFLVSSKFEFVTMIKSMRPLVTFSYLATLPLRLPVF